MHIKLYRLVNGLSWLTPADKDSSTLIRHIDPEITDRPLEDILPHRFAAGGDLELLIAAHGWTFEIMSPS